MKVYRVNKFTGAVKQIFGKPKEIAGKVLRDFNGFAERMGVAKIGSAIKAAPVVQKVGMAVATVAVAGGTAAGIVAINQPAPAPTQPSTPAITQPKAEETKPEKKVEETKPEETKPEEKPAATEQPAESHEAAPSPTAPAAPQEPAVEQPKAPAEPVKLGEQHVFYGTSAVDNMEYTSSYGYNGEFSSYDEALTAVKDRLARAGKATPGGLFEKTIVFYSDGTSEVIESHRVI